MRILLIEDDKVLGAAVRDQVAADGHSMDWVMRLDAARDALAVAAYDLVLLDLMLPDGRGIPFLRAMRARGDVTPVIILTALDQVSDRIEGLNAGADDYLVKPFDLTELSARIGSVARRYSGNPNPSSGWARSRWTSPPAAVRRDGTPRSADSARMGAFRGLRPASGATALEGAARRTALLLRHRDREQHDRGACEPHAQEARPTRSSRRSAASATGWDRP